MGIVFALLAAAAFAGGNVLQQKGTLETPAGGDDPRFLVQILARPVWLAGAALQASGWVLQAAALNLASLVVVQSLTMLSLVVALPLGARITGQRIGRREMVGALAVVVGIALFLSVGSPGGGTAHPTASAWWSAGLTSLVLVGVAVVLGQRRQGAARALLFGAGAGIAFGLQAAVTKVFVGELGHGVLALLSSWTVYVLIISALTGFALMQSALKTGVLAPAIAASNSLTLFASVVLGITLFGESLGHGGGQLTPAVIGLAVALAGISRLAAAPNPATLPDTGAPTR
jgi:drug/metabolite transporter (DMT)-like permease